MVGETFEECCAAPEAAGRAYSTVPIRIIFRDRMPCQKGMRRSQQHRA